MANRTPKILVSACLLGLKTNYKGEGKEIDQLVKLWKEGKVVYVCPEQIGGLTTPREPSEIEEGKSAKDVLEGKGRVLTQSGKDETEQYLRGARQTLGICKKLGITTAILKARSPSCGSEQVYDGTFTNKKVVGSGITAELLRQNGIKVFDEEHIPKDLH